MIIKEFKKDCPGFFGQDIQSWTDNWAKTESIIESSRKAEKDHFSPFFKKYFPLPPSKILEGGCGTGKYVISYRRKGYDIVGVDFSGEAVRRIKKELGEDFQVHEADITELPFADDYFDCYYSGGVIEHFEEGPDKALKEACRVIKKGGTFLVVVPYINLIRRIFFLIFSKKERKTKLYAKVKDCQRDSNISGGYNFCEYFFDVNSLKAYLIKNGFSIEKIYPTNFLWGELGLIARKFINGQHNRSKVKTLDNAPIKESINRGTLGNKTLIRNLIYEFLVTENIDNLFLRFPLMFLNYISGHLVLFVVRKV